MNYLYRLSADVVFAAMLCAVAGLALLSAVLILNRIT